MSIEARKLWTDALRSGKYEQGREYLKKDNTYCCLGVACELYEQHVGGLGIETNDEGVTKFGVNTFVTPMKVSEWLGIVGNGSLEENNYSNLASMNDSGKFSFHQIADVIETEGALCQP